MADPFSIAAGVVGIVAPALHATRLLLEDLQNISEAPDIVATLRRDVSFVELTLKSLETISPPHWTALGATVVKLSKDAIDCCTKSCTEFRTDLKRWTRHSQDGGMSWRDRAGLGLFRQNQIKAMSEQLQKYRATLTVVTSTATLHSSMRNQRTTEELKDAIAAIKKDFADSITSTDQQLATLDTQSKSLNPTDIEHGNNDDTEDAHKDEAGMRRTIGEERAMLHVMLKLLEGLKIKTQDEVKKMAEEEQQQTTQATLQNDNLSIQLNQTTTTFGHGNHGSQVGSNYGTITNEFHLPPEQSETPPKPSCTIPFSRDTDFVVRGSLLDQIHHACSRPAARAALVGLGGVGKSQLAIEYCYRAREIAIQKNTDLWVFWIHAETQARIEEGFKQIAETIKLPERKQPKVDIPQLLEQWLCNVENGPWLLVLDNADNANVIFDANNGTTDIRNTTANAGQARGPWTYLPQCPHGSILITSRNKEVARRLTGNHRGIIDVPAMDKDHALELLVTKAGSQPDMDGGAELVEALEYMPLAISQAAAYIQQQAPRTSIHKYLQEFQKSERRKLSLLDRDEQSLRRDRNASNSVIVTWQISFDSIRSKRPSAADLLSLMSFFDRQGIPEWLLRPPDDTVSQDSNASDCESDVSEHSKCRDDDDSDASEGSAALAFEDDLMILRDYCLISLDKAGDIFEMHNLVQLAMRKWLDAYKRTEEFKEQFISRIAREFPTGDYSNWATCQTLFAHVQRAINHRPTGGKPLEKWAQVLYNGSWYAKEQGRYSLAETMARKSLDARIETLGHKHRLTCNSMLILGGILCDQGKYKKAEKLEVEVLEIRKQELGPAHSDTLTSMANLASTYWNQGRWEEAEELEVEVLEIRKQKLGPVHPDTLTSIANLASTYSKQGRWEEAEELGVEVLEIRKQKLGPAHPDTLVSMANLAFTWYDQERTAEAIDLMDSRVQLRRKALGPEQPDDSKYIKALEEWRAEQVIPLLAELGSSADV